MSRGNRSLARGLACFGIGLGAVEILAPRGLAKAIGLQGYERTLQLFGLREIVSGMLMISGEAPETRVGLRVAGDVLDGGVLTAGLASSNPHRSRTLMAAVVVASVVILDVACWLRMRSEE